MNRMKKRFLSGLLAVSLLGGSISTVTAVGISSADEASEAWYTSTLTEMEAKGYLDFLSVDNLLPGLTATRGFAARLLAEVANVDLETVDLQSVSFSDVTENSEYASAIAWATQIGAINGDENGRFGIYVGITREQLASMIYQYSIYAGVSLPQDQESYTFKDSDQISDWAADAVSAVAQAGLMIGDARGYYSPQNTVTCAEACVILYQLAQQMEEASGGGDVVSIARTQLEETDGKKNDGTTYQTWAGISDQDWSCAFVYWVAEQAGYTGSKAAYGSVTTSVPEAWYYFKSLGETYGIGSGYEPQAGDLIFYYSTEEYQLTHMGIVERYDVATDTVYLISSSVATGKLAEQTVRWDPNDTTESTQTLFVYGFASPDYGTEATAQTTTTQVTTVSSQFQGGDAYAVADYIYAYLVANGYTTEAACGILGNIYQECRFEYNLEYSGGTGICQWIGGRKTNLIAYCETNGYDYLSLEGQLAFLINEDLQAQDYYFGLRGSSVEAYKTLTDTEDATTLFYICFERPRTPQAATRISVALAFYDRYVNGYTGSIGDLG